MVNEVALPTLTLDKALEVARDYLSKNSVDISAHFLIEAHWREDSSESAWMWHFTWMTEEQFKEYVEKPRLRGGGHLNVTVSDVQEVKYHFVR